ncbi:hypothetical protein HZC20_03560 [Candidatus Peregrinibacteria bacterium]|nr:hypothetical protein [Candidatus Peregrinibacteria bacterium]
MSNHESQVLKVIPRAMVIATDKLPEMTFGKVSKIIKDTQTKALHAIESVGGGGGEAHAH